MNGVWRARPTDPRLLDSADKIFSPFLCDPQRYDDIRYQVLDELAQRAAFLRNLSEEERLDEWQDEEGRRIPADYRHYKSRDIPPEDDTRLSTEMFEPN